MQETNRELHVIKPHTRQHNQTKFWQWTMSHKWSRIRKDWGFVVQIGVKVEARARFRLRSMVTDW